MISSAAGAAVRRGVGLRESLAPPPSLLKVEWGGAQMSCEVLMKTEHPAQ